MFKYALAAAAITVMLPFTLVAQTAPLAPSPAASSVPAPETTTRGKFRAACGADIAKHCKDQTIQSTAATPEQFREQRGKIRVCLTTHSATISADCKAILSEREAASQAKKS